MFSPNIFFIFKSLSEILECYLSFVLQGPFRLNESPGSAVSQSLTNSGFDGPVVRTRNQAPCLCDAFLLHRTSDRMMETSPLLKCCIDFLMFKHFCQWQGSEIFHDSKPFLYFL
jgi:hypothetical protein